MATSLKKAVILLSGGLDSATTLAIAHNKGYECYGLSFDYGQRQIAELNAAKQLAATYCQHHHIITLNPNTFKGSALTDRSIAVPKYQESEHIPITYVPARNTIFLSFALAYAETLSASDIFIGVNAIDYSGYPDCRPEYISAYETMANLATKAGIQGNKLTIHTPLITLTKAEIIKCGVELELDYSQTVSCYQADEEGKACGICDSCTYRRAGFSSLGLADPTHYQ